MADTDPLPDYYAILGVSAKATEAEVRSAYRRCARIWHPDANPDGCVGERMAAVNEAVSVLSDPARRADYDRRRRLLLPPRPRIEPPVADFGTIGPSCSGETVSLHVLNDGGEPATVRVDPESGPFWQLSRVRGPENAEEVAVLELEPRSDHLPPGTLHSSLRVYLDDEAAAVVLSAFAAPTQAGGKQTRPGSIPPPAPPARAAWGHRRRHRALSLLGAALLAGVLLGWPGASLGRLPGEIAGALGLSGPPGRTPHGTAGALLHLERAGQPRPGIPRSVVGPPPMKPPVSSGRPPRPKFPLAGR